MDFLRRHKILLLILVIAVLYYPRFIKRPAGMTDFPFAANCMLHEEVMKTCAPIYTYPPVFAFFMIPFVPLPMGLRNVLWYAILVGATVASFRLCERLTLRTLPAPLQGNELRAFRILALLLSLKFILSVFENQAYDVVVLLCVLVGLEGLTAGKDFRASAGFALGAALKATPLLFLPYLLLRRSWKPFLYCVVLYAGLSLLPDVFFTPKGASSGYFGAWLQEIAGGAFLKKAGTQWWEGVNILNQALRTPVYRLTLAAGAQNHFPAIIFAVHLAYILAVAALLVLSARIEKPHALDGSVLVVSMLLLSPMSSKSHFVVLMLPYAVSAAYLVAEPRLRRVGGILLGASFALNTLTSRGIIGDRLSTLALSAGCVAIGTLILLFFMGYVILDRRNQPSRPQLPSLS